MIEGLKIDFTSADLKEMLGKRFEHHLDRHSFYAKQVAGFDDEGIGAGYVSNDPRQSMSASARHHADRAGFFALVAAHLVPNEIYRLGDHDLDRLELVSQYL